MFLGPTKPLSVWPKSGGGGCQKTGAPVFQQRPSHLGPTVLLNSLATAFKSNRAIAPRGNRPILSPCSCRCPSKFQPRFHQGNPSFTRQVSADLGASSALSSVLACWLGRV